MKNEALPCEEEFELEFPVFFFPAALTTNDLENPDEEKAPPFGKLISKAPKWSSRNEDPYSEQGATTMFLRLPERMGFSRIEVFNSINLMFPVQLECRAPRRSIVDAKSKVVEKSGGECDKEKRRRDREKQKW